MAAYFVPRGAEDLRFQARIVGEGQVVHAVTDVANEVIVLLLPDEPEAGFAGSEGELAQEALGDEDPERPVHGGQADPGMRLPKPGVDPVHRGVDGVLLQEGEDDVPVLEGSRHGGPSPT
jgi:hypothetical protein